MFYSSASIFILGMIAAIVISAIQRLLGDTAISLNISLLIITVVFAFGSVYSIIALNEVKKMHRQLVLENKYALGHETDFYNLPAFKDRVYTLKRKFRLKNRPQFIISFTTASLENSVNTYQIDDMNDLNYEMSQFIVNYFNNGTGYFAFKNIAYCYNRGTFYIYTFVDNEDQVKEIVKEIMNATYAIVKENDLKIWAQPFFGVREVDKDLDLTVAIENASMARVQGEVNFESYTKYAEKGESKEESGILEELERAIANGEFIAYYQPKFNVNKKEIVSCEALARWNSPTKGILAPGMFIDKAEQFGLISTIDLRIFECALKDLSDSIKKGRRVVPVSSNFSLYEFFSHSFLDTIINLIEQYQVPPRLVEIEITETTSQVNQFLSVSVIKKLKEYGIRVLMDDYGVGYSQISTLNSIPFDAIKIDKSFADLMLDDEKTRSIVKFLIELGHTNNLEVIIEGVEKKEQVDMLKKMHIDTIQGFYYSKALSFKDFNEFLKKNPFEGGGKVQ